MLAVPLLLPGRGQTLRTVATPDVTAKIARVAGIADQSALTSRDVLNWTMHNTVQATLRGVVEWSQQVRPPRLSCSA